MKNTLWVLAGAIFVASAVIVGSASIVEHASATEVLVVRGFTGLAAACGLLAIARPWLAPYLAR